MVLEQALVALAREVVVACGGSCRFQRVVDELWDDLAGGILTRERLDELVDDAIRGREGPLACLGADLVADVARCAERSLLTRRLTEEEVATSTLDVSIDLALFGRLGRFDGGLHDGDGSPLRVRDRRERGAGRAGALRRTTHLEGPPGWLATFAPGTLVAARAAGGFLSLEPVDESASAPPPAGLAERLGALLDVVNEGDGSPVDADALQLLATLEPEPWFDRPHRPFGELVEEAGFEVDGSLVGRPGCWAPHKELADLVGSLARHPGDEAEMSLLADVLKAFAAWRSDPATARPPAGLSERLRLRWPVSYWVLEELRRRGAGPEDLTAFAEVLGGAPGRWLASRAAALAGDAGSGERLARAAAEADPGFGPSLAEVAWYAADRGRAREAVNLLHRVRDHDHPGLVLLRRLAAASAPSVGRNDRCPCGSGRKYKVCHLGRSALGDEDRVRWLLDKLVQYALDVVPPEELDDAIPPTDDPGGLALGMDVLAFDGGWLARFRRDRGPLLPEGERAWLDRWVGENIASVFRLVARHPDGRTELEDVRTARRHVVGATPVLDGVSVDRLVWARLVPVDDLWWTTGVVRPCSLSERDGLLDAFAPGTSARRRLEALVPDRDGLVLQNTSGDPTVTCTTVVRVGDAADAEKRLDEAFERDGESPEWHTTADTPGMADAVTARYRLDGGLLRIETNSLARRAAALDRLAGVVEIAEVVEDTRVPIARSRAADDAEDLIDVAYRAVGPGAFEDDDVDDELDEDEDEDGASGEELRAALAEIRARHDERWLDQPVPVLGGRTPREAAADDAGRRDLRTLLAEMEDRWGIDDADRMRERLGVERAPGGG